MYILRQPHDSPGFKMWSWVPEVHVDRRRCERVGVGCDGCFGVGSGEKRRQRTNGSVENNLCKRLGRLTSNFFLSLS